MAGNGYGSGDVIIGGERERRSESSTDVLRQPQHGVLEPSGTNLRVARGGVDHRSARLCTSVSRCQLSASLFSRV
eukprot:scaffold15965_cov111-Isochrysis_galbana.AAC.6